MNRLHLLYKLLLAVVLVQGVAFADTVINFASSGGNGITLTQTSGGEYLTFSNLYIGSGSIAGNNLTTDSAMNAPVTISPGAGGHFYMDSVSSDGLTGYFASNSAATISIGNTKSGFLTGSLGMIELDTNTSHQYPNGHGSFTLSLTLTNMQYTCGAGCTYSQLLSTFAATGNGTNNAYDTITFTFNSKTNVSSLLGSNGSTTAAGSLDSFYDTAAPEPASLALFGSCLLMAGIKVRQKVKNM